MAAAPFVSMTGLYDRIRKACKEAGGQSAWARSLGLSPSMISDVLNARSNPGPKILKALKLTQATVFLPTKE